MKMKNLLYIGNKLSKHGLNKTTIETLGASLEKEGYTLYYTSEKKQFFFRIIDMIVTLLRVNRKIDYVIIDVYSTKAFWYAFICSQLARFLKLRYIPILHGGNLPVRLNNSPFLSKLIFKNAYKNVAPSNYLKSAFEKLGYTNVIHIPNTIEIEKYVFTERNTFQPKLLWVRAFATIYNPIMAVSVLFELQKKYPNASLTMVGPDKDGSLKLVQEKAKQLRVEIEFTGRLSKQEWWELSKKQDFFINTTHFDNTPVSIMEAMALGLPIITTNVGGIPYLLTNNENALLVNDNNVNEMVKAIEIVLTNPQKAIKMIKKARLDIENKDWDIIKEKWDALLC